MVRTITLSLSLAKFARFAHLRMAANPVFAWGFAGFAGFASTHAEMAKSEVC